MKKEQIEVLADFIMANIKGEPSKSEGAGDTAIRIIKQLQTKIKQLEAELDKWKPKVQDDPHGVCAFKEK